MKPVILGIIALVLSFLFPIVGIILAIIGVIVGISGAIKKDKESIVCLVLSAIALALGIYSITISVKSAQRIVDTSRKDTFATTAISYINAVRNSVLAGEIVCSTTASEDATNQFASVTNNGDYYIFLSSGGNAITNNSSGFNATISSKAEEQSSNLLELGNKSPWGKIDVYGYVHFNFENGKYTYYVALADVDGHGFAYEKQQKNINRTVIETENVKVDMNKVLNTINSNPSAYYCHVK